LAFVAIGVFAAVWQLERIRQILDRRPWFTRQPLPGRRLWSGSREPPSHRHRSFLLAQPAGTRVILPVV